MTVEKTFTLAQLRAAFILWENDVRANRDGFQTDEECREAPIDEAADGYVECMSSYLDKAKKPTSYSKPKDRYLAVLFVCVGFVFIPLSVLWYLLVAVKDSIVESWQGLRREFAGGPKATAIYEHQMAMDAFAHRRARRERERKA